MAKTKEPNKPSKIWLGEKVALSDPSPLETLKRQYGDRLIQYKGTWYERGAAPNPLQEKPTELPDGTPIRFVAWFDKAK